MIYAQSDKGKTSEEAGPTISGTDEALKLIQVFGKENQRSDFDWDAAYGEGSEMTYLISSFVY
ncbi:hypothetical protein AMATHDRAFT_2221 [Amanita thiersii Skay4041]|uniref:Uncharacterized protein n=1 Tax=Amanita thiersii Skay4041 TaxID=703135 RepID=A0A2A9NNE4_9AGAR|nr:hypothetical protein AMATHDRAFT_2221 [Amanita thiersii Skay4041]